MDCFDEEYGKHSDYITRIQKHPSIPHIGNEKKLFSLLTSYHQNPPAPARCMNAHRCLLFPFLTE